MARHVEGDHVALSPERLELGTEPGEVEGHGVQQKQGSATIPLHTCDVDGAHVSREDKQDDLR